jgi:succinyl-CoA:(S)-malate CoA-transferase subunit A
MVHSANASASTPGQSGVDGANTSAHETALPLAGLRVIDVGNFLAGPYAASILGEFGAEVIKVEHPDGGDPMRRFGTASRDPDTTLNWLNEARNRKSITLNLLKPQGLEIFKRLIGKSDVLVENFRPGTAESWGLGWPEVHATNPSIVMLRVSGYGQTGPYRRRSGSGHIAQAFGGLNYLAGFPGETPVLPGTVPIGDYIASLFGAIGVLVALRHKDQTGRGQLVDVGTYEAILRVLEEIAPAYALFGKIREREGAGSFIAVPHGHFRTQDNKWIAIACTTDKMFERLSVAMGRPDLASQDLYGQQSKRLAAREIVNQHVIDWVGSMPRKEVLQSCLSESVPVGNVNSIADIFDDPHFVARGNLVRFNDEDVGEVVVPGVVPTLSKTPGRISGLGPKLGNANQEVLGTLLGMASDEIEQLRKKQII